MGTNGRLSTQAQALRYWLLQHSGQPERAPQCKQHPPVSELTHAQIRELVERDLRMTVSRFWLAQVCDQLGIERRHRRGPPGPDAGTTKKRAKARYQRWYARLRADPERWRKYVAKKCAEQRAQRAVA